jgi:hypothetical protein
MFIFRTLKFIGATGNYVGLSWVHIVVGPQWLGLKSRLSPSRIRDRFSCASAFARSQNPLLSRVTLLEIHNINPATVPLRIIRFIPKMLTSWILLGLTLLVALVTGVPQPHLDERAGSGIALLEKITDGWLPVKLLM